MLSVDLGAKVRRLALHFWPNMLRSSGEVTRD